MAILRDGMMVAALVLLGSSATTQERNQGTPEGGYGTAAELKRYIQVQGIWGRNGYQITAVRPGGPASRVQSEDGSTTAALEPGDTIVEVDGMRIESQVDYARAMNGAPDPQHIQIRVRDRRSGRIYTWYVGSRSSPYAR